MEIRNPYLILGLPFGAPRDEAKKAFLAKARMSRRGAPGSVPMTDLTWALNQIEGLIGNPGRVMDIYRIPADPDMFTAPGSGAFAPGPEKLRPRPADRAVRQPDPRAAREFLRHLIELRSARLAPPQP